MEKFNIIVNYIRQMFNHPDGLISLHSPIFQGNEKKYLQECIDTSFVSSVGNFVDQFEIEIAKYTGSKRAVACVNGTSALHLALKLVGVEQGDEVITQPLSFVATANAIKYLNASPVFLDVDKETLGLCHEGLKDWLSKNVEIKDSKLSSQPQSFNKETGKRISACIPMHTFGHPCRIDEIVKTCNQYYIPVVEDAAESLGSFYKKNHTGTFGEIGVLSFNGNKIITTGGGGMLLFNNEDAAIKAKHLSTQAKVPHPWKYVHDEIGYNYRMPNINAALGLAQLEQLESFLAQKRKISTDYNTFFSNNSFEITYFREPANAKSNYWLNSILFSNKKERDRFLRYTNENGIMTRPAWVGLNKLRMFKDCARGDLSNCEWLYDRIVNIPSSVH